MPRYTRHAGLADTRLCLNAHNTVIDAVVIRDSIVEDATASGTHTPG